MTLVKQKLQEDLEYFYRALTELAESMDKITGSREGALARTKVQEAAQWARADAERYAKELEKASK
jgi:hypothetical protein